jgi:diguanylate cyclase (GGDEF)-like protein
MTTPREGGARPTRPGPRPLTLVIFFMAAMSVALFVVRLRFLGLHESSDIIWIAVSAVAFMAVEVLPLHIEWAGQAYSLSLSEAPLVAGLLWWPSWEFVVARVIGGAVALVCFRKQPPQKLAFNIVLQLLEVSAPVAIFTQIVGRHPGPPMHVAPAVLAAVCAGTAISVSFVCIAVRISVGELDRQVVSSFARMSAFGIVVNTSMALVLSTAVRAEPLVGGPMVVTLLASAGFYKAYVSLRQRHSSLEMLYQFTSGLNQSTTDNRIRDILQRTGDMLRADLSGLLLYGTDSGDPPVLRWIGADGLLHTEDYLVDGDDAFDAVVAGGDIVVIPRTTRSEAQQHFLAARNLKDATLAPLRLDGQVRGVLFVANRQGDVASFTADDGKLFQTVAVQVSSVLDNSRLLDRLTHDSLHDALTGLANRQCFQGRLRSALQRDGARLAVLLTDLDRFKEINDTLGHHHGDLLIREIAGRIEDGTPNNATVARLGGDEFAIMLPGATAEQARAVAAKIRSAVRESCTLDGVSVQVDISIGVAVVPEHGTDDSVLLKRADMAMYAAKSGHTGVEVYDKERDEYSPRRLALASKLREAIATNQMVLHYQPQIEAASGRVVGVEALVRWQHPEFGLVPPLEFVPAAEQSGLIRELTIWVLTTAVDQISTWREAGLDITMSVNVSMRDLRDASVLDALKRLLAEHNLPPEALMLEITESHLMSDPARTLPVLHSIASLGVRLSVDDFGTGYSSLSYLRDLPVNEVKIDKSFIMPSGDSPRDDAIVKAIVSLSQHLDLETVAEGIEDEMAAEALAALGCTRLQGYHIARPMPGRDFLNWLALRNVPGPARASA